MDLLRWQCIRYSIRHLSDSIRSNPELCIASMLSMHCSSWVIGCAGSEPVPEEIAIEQFLKDATEAQLLLFN